MQTILHASTQYCYPMDNRNFCIVTKIFQG